jgi:uncharacterized membrane protein YuzA (DUF378 family)
MSVVAGMAGFIIQIAFYIVVGFSALWATILFSRYVKYVTTDAIDDGSLDEVSVDEFVE